VKTLVPRRTSITLSTGEKACVKCFKRPAMMRRTGRGPRTIPGSYCRICATEYNRQRRAGKTEVLVTAEELALLKELRQTRPKGRHHVAAAVAALLFAIVLAGSASTGIGRASVVHHRPAHVCQTPAPSGATYHVIPAGISLARWSNEHAGGTGNVLSATIQCGPGVQSLALMSYLDRAHLWERLPHQVGVWVPFGDYHRAF
jgi:hypothetical protein